VASEHDEVGLLLEQCAGLSMRRGVPGDRCTTFAIGGPIDYLVEPADIGSLCSLIRALHREGFLYRVLGAGSNLLIADEGISGIVIRLGAGFRTIDQRLEGIFSIGAASSVMRLARDISAAGFAGLEFAGGIPASLGGAVVMNAGAHGGEFGDVLERVGVVLQNGRYEEIERGDLKISYRHGGIPEGAIVVSAELKLTSADGAAVAEKRARFLSHRKETQPLHLPSAGSVFRNPSGHYAGELIERVGMKGVRFGGAEISSLHANWIVNTSRAATAAEVRHLMDTAIETVQLQHDVKLVPEVRIWS
jgi:UDP-N-acetylmuramate dehydrogenase